MSAEERKSIANAIWLCANHARYIDRDEASYTTEVIRGWKRDHEGRIKAALASGGLLVTDQDESVISDMISLGPDIIAVGSLQGMQASKWSVHISHFVTGSINSLVSFGESFDSRSPGDRYLLLDSFGDGRVLAIAPSWARRGTGVDLAIDVLPRFTRTAAQDLGTDLRLDNGDITPAGDLISGVARVPQLVETVLGTRRGESASAPEFGSRLSEYYALYSGTPWLERLVKLEIVRMAAIPSFDPMLQMEYTQLQCVDRVLSAQILSEDLTNRRLPMHIALEVAGLGRWEHDIKVYVSEYPPAPPPIPPSISAVGL